MGSGASIVLDPGEIKTSEAGHSKHRDSFGVDELEIKQSINILESPKQKLDKSPSNLILNKSKSKESLDSYVQQNKSPLGSPKLNAEVKNSEETEKFSIFEEPLVEDDLTALESSPDNQKQAILRNIVSGEVHGNVLQAQLSMKSIPKQSHSQHNEYLLQKSPSKELDGDKLHPTKPANVRRSMQLKLNNQLGPFSMSSLDSLPALQEIKEDKRKSGLESFLSLPNMSLDDTNFSKEKPP